jgi:hypothetical protein
VLVAVAIWGLGITAFGLVGDLLWVAFACLAVAGGPRVGDFEAGLVAAVFTPTVSIVSGGLICIAGVVALAAAVPEFARYEAPRSEEPSRSATR